MPASDKAIVQLGTYNPVTDTFTSVLDLNDYTNISQMSGSPEMDPPQKNIQRNANPRTDGERITNTTYGNRSVMMKMSFGKAASYATIRGLISTFVALVENPNLVIRYCPPSPNVSLNYSYLDVLAVTHDADKFDPRRIINQTARINAVFECSPYFRGDRQYLQNLAWNPGFEAPAGGGAATTMPVVFSDAFTNVNAYTVAAGSAPTTGPSNAYTDIILTDNPLRYHRLGEIGGTALDDIGGTGQTATLSANASGLTATGLVTGDSDKALTFASASSHKATLPVGGNLPTGNGTFTLEALVNIAGAPGANAYAVSIGANSSKTGGSLYIDTARKVNCDLGGGGGLVTSGAAISTGAVHHIACTWDGTTLTLYVDGASTGTPTTPGANNIAASPPSFIGANPAGSAGFFNGTLDECAIYGAALSSGRISAHNTAKGGATGTISGAMSIPASARVQFGNAQWGAVAAWYVRFRWNSSTTLLRWALHETDESNMIRVTFSAGTLAIAHVIGGVTNTLASGSVTLTHEAWYWLKVSLLPAPAGVSPLLIAQIFYDDNGVVGSQVASASLSAATTDPITAMTGKPQIAVSGSAIVIGGASGGHTVALFGPGSWGTVIAAGSATGTASCAWDGVRNEIGQSGLATAGTQTYANGPVTSFASARIDAAPAGTFDAYWYLYSGGSPGGTAAMPVLTVGDVVYAACQIKSSGLGNGATISLKYQEYDSSGSLLRSGTLQTFTVSAGVQSSWAVAGSSGLSGHWTTGASCAYVAILIEAADTTSGSVNGTVWIDNVQVWDSTVAGATTMPYCELRFGNSPAQLLLSGLLGDVPAPAALYFGTWFSSVSSGAIFSFWAGLRARAGASAQLIGVGQAFASSLSTSAYGGFLSSTTTSTSFNIPGWTVSQMLAGDHQGVYRLLYRIQTAQIAGNLSAMAVQNYVAQSVNNSSGAGATMRGKLITPSFSASAAQQITDAGLLSLPPTVYGTRSDLTTMAVQPAATWTDPNGAGIAATWNWLALLPADEGASLMTGQITFPTSLSAGIAQVFIDGLNAQLQRNDIDITGALYVSNTYTAAMRPDRAESTVGVSGASAAGGTIGVDLGQDSIPQVDPTIKVGTTSGINQGLAIISDVTGNVYPFSADVAYTPLFLYPRS